MVKKGKNKEKGRRTVESTLREKAKKKILLAHPETVEIAISKAHGVARNIVCPFCQNNFDVKVGDKAEKDLLIRLMDGVEGKPKQIAEIDLKAKLELDASQLLALFNRLEEFRKERAAETIDVVEAEFKEIKEPELPQQILAPPSPAVTFSEPQKQEPVKSEPIAIMESEQYGVKD